MYFDINIETIILVAIWKHHSIFQGCFKVTTPSNPTSSSYIFRCESSIADKCSFMANDFSPTNYIFTDLYYNDKRILLDQIIGDTENALYLLKYSLDLTLRKMVTSQNQNWTMIDKVAMRSLSKRVEDIIGKTEEIISDSIIGFAVVVPFVPTEELGHQAALILFDGIA